MKTTVLIVEPHAFARAGIRSTLQDCSQLKVVGEAATGEEAVAMARQLAPEVLVMAIELPHMDGLDVAELLRDELPAIRIILLSMHRNWRYIERAIRAGNCGYLLKDAPLEELVATVKKVANGESLLRREGENKRSSETSPATVERPRLAQLTSRERKILIYIASGRSNEYIAKRLGIAQQRVESHKETIRRKLGISSTAGLTKFAIANGLTELLEIPGDTPKD